MGRVDFKWFNWGFGAIGSFKLFNMFNRHVGNIVHYWGFGICQYRSRHLFYVGHSGVSILFIGETA